MVNVATPDQANFTSRLGNIACSVEKICSPDSGKLIKMKLRLTWSCVVIFSVATSQHYFT